MRHELVIVRYKNTQMPEEFLLKAAELYPTAAGIAFVENGKVEMQTFDPLELETDLLSTIMEIEKKLPDKDVFYHLIKVDDLDTEGLDSDSLQPFNIISDGDNCHLAVMVEGEFNDYIREGENTPTYNFVNEYLSEKILDIYNDKNKNLLETLKRLDAPAIRKDLQPHLSPRGTIFLIPAQGNAMSFTANAELLGKEFPWGLVTNALGYEEPEAVIPEAEKAAAPVAAAPPPRQLTIAERKARAAALANAKPGADTPAVVEPKPTSVPLSLPVPEPGKIPTDAPFLWKGKTTDGNTVVFEKTKRPGSVLWCKVRAGAGHDEAKKFWTNNCNYDRPKDDKLMLAGFPATALKPNAALRHSAIALGLLESATAMRDAMSKATTPTKTAVAAVDSMQKHADHEDTLDREAANPLLVPAEGKQKALALFKEKLPSMEELLAAAEEYPPYSKQVSIPFSETICWTPKTLMTLDLKSVVAWGNEARMALYKANQKLFKIAQVEEKQEAAPVQTATAPTRQLTIAERKAARAQTAA